jgi:hypothetical protein
MDQLDETYSSWMRDIRLGKGRVFVSREMLESPGPGLGATFDADQEIFSPIKSLGGGKDQPVSNLIQAEQFAIRYQEHAATADKLVENILRTSGYSPQTFGMDDGRAKASNMTATEVQAHERRSYLTRDRKMRLTKPQVVAITAKLLWVDKAVFNTPGIVPTSPNVVFSDSVQESQITLAQTVQALEAARAASTKTKVQMLHPDWDDDAIDKEVQLINDEQGAQVPDPSTFTGFGAPPDQPPATPPGK